MNLKIAISSTFQHSNHSWLSSTLDAFRRYIYFGCMVGLLCAPLKAWSQDQPESTQAQPGSSQGPSVDRFDESFKLGVTAYQAKKYEEAKTSFSQALTASPNNVQALTNLALTHYQLGAKGWSIALLRKAQDLDPDFSTSLAALEFIEPQLEVKELPHEIQTWESFRKAVLIKVPVQSLGLLTALILFATGWLLINHLHRRKQAFEQKTLLPEIHWVLIFSVFLLFCFSGLTGAKVWDLQTARATIVTPRVNVLSAPAPEAPVLFELYEGLEVIIRRAENSWVQVTYPGGMTGWIPKQDLFHTSGKAPW